MMSMFPIILIVLIIIWAYSVPLSAPCLVLLSISLLLVVFSTTFQVPTSFHYTHYQNLPDDDAFSLKLQWITDNLASSLILQYAVYRAMLPKLFNCRKTVRLHCVLLPFYNKSAVKITEIDGVLSTIKYEILCEPVNRYNTARISMLNSSM